MEKQKDYRHRLIINMPMRLLMFLIQEKAFSRFIDNIINLNDREIDTNTINLNNAFSWRDDKRFYIVYEDLIEGVEYWIRLYNKYSRKYGDRSFGVKEVKKSIDKML